MQKDSLVRLMPLVVIMLILFVVIQLGTFFISRDRMHSMFSERWYKLELSNRLIGLSKTYTDYGGHDVKSELISVASDLSKIVYTSEGKTLVGNFINILSAESGSDEIQPVLPLAQHIDGFQRKRLSDDIQILEQQFNRLGILVSGITLASTGIFTVVLFWVWRRIKKEYTLTQLVVQNTRNGVLVGDTKGLVTTVNPSYEQLLGLSPAAGQKLEEAGDPGKALAESIKNRSFVFGKELIVNGPSKQMCLSIDSIPWYDNRGGLIGGMMVLRDNTENWLEKQSVRKENLFLKEKVNRDPLTDLFNYSALMKTLNKMLTQAQEQKQNLAFLMVDIDNFKIYNDTFGHPAGDRLLQGVADIMRKVTRENDVIARYGGDEFAIILPGAGPNQSREAGERLRKAIEEHPFAGREQLPGGRVTVSVGIAIWPSNAQSMEELIHCADKALYESKRMARNRVEVYFSGLGEISGILGESINGMPIITIKSLLLLLQSRDRYTYHHAEKVVRYSSWIGEELGLSRDSLHILKVAALVHDLGKIYVDKDILTKRGRLSPEEWEEIKRHSVYGVEILRPIIREEEIINAVHYHHEHWNGGGYPAGISGNQIPLLSRIISVADAFEAMTSERPYRPAMSTATAIEELKSKSDLQFDLELVEAFMQKFDGFQSVVCLCQAN